MSAHHYALALAELDPGRRVGYVRKIAAGHVEASGPLSAVGDICEIGDESEARARVSAEVVAVETDHIVLVPLDPSANVQPDAPVIARPFRRDAMVGDAFAGRAVDAMAAPIDAGPPVQAEANASLAGIVLAPMQRLEPDTILETGIRALDGLLTFGRGQRVGVFSASGVGKTMLMKQLAAQVSADRCVLCLVGERGREVEALWRELSSRSDADRFTCVAATSDLSAPLRVRAVYQALALAEYWRAQGEQVLLVLDSVTRFAMALREIGLAAGAPPTLRAYTPNVFSALPRIVERCGAQKGGGSISAIMTVLSETDDNDDPLVEMIKALLDGHIVLSRRLAEQGHFPAIDVVRSVSRQSERLMAPAHGDAARKAIALLATYDDARMMIESGLYKAGSNPRVDEALRKREAILGFLRQKPDERANLDDTLALLLREMSLA